VSLAKEKKYSFNFILIIMSLTRQEIIDYASRYMAPDAGVDFPFDGDLFCLFGRELIEGKELKEEEGWGFQGYGICSGYTVDTAAKPAGKWLWMHFLSLTIFPPSPQVFKLQPPHVVKGRFQDPSHTREFRIIKVGMKKSGHAAEKDIPAPDPVKGKIVPFRKKKP
jgi:hypothetical protein